MQYSFRMRAAFAAAIALTSSLATAAVWDSGGGTSSWYTATNWSGDTLPATGATHEINNGYAFAGEGVVFDPVSDPANLTGSNTYTLGGAGGNYRLYIGNGASAASSKLTIKSGVLQMTDAGDNIAIGRSSGTTGTTGIIVQTGGSFLSPSDNIDIGNLNGTVTSNGVYDFRGGALTGGTTSATSHGIRLGVGAGSTGTFISRRDSAGTITLWNYVSAQGTGVGITEFHYNNGGVNTIDVQNNLSLNNDGTAARRSHLNFALDAVPQSKGDDGTFYIPEDIGLINVDSDGNSTGNGVSGAGNGLFWNLAGTDSLVEGDTVSATFGGFTYNWQIQYHGDIAGGTIAATGGKDVVLIGLSSTQPVPEPASLGVLALAAMGALRRRRA